MRSALCLFATLAALASAACAPADPEGNLPSEADHHDGDVASIEQALLEGCPEKILAQPKIEGGFWSFEDPGPMEWDLSGADFWAGGWWCGYQRPGHVIAVRTSTPPEAPHCRGNLSVIDCLAPLGCREKSCTISKAVVKNCPVLTGGDPVGYVKNGERIMDWPDNYAGGVTSSQLFSIWDSNVSGGSPSEFGMGLTKNGTLRCEYMAAIEQAYLVLGVP